jgi:hypothetical protein
MNHYCQGSIDLTKEGLLGMGVHPTQQIDFQQFMDIVQDIPIAIKTIYASFIPTCMGCWQMLCRTFRPT